MEWWNSVASMERVTRGLIAASAIFGMIAVVALPFQWVVSAVSVIFGVTAICCSLFAWFRLDDLRERGL